MTLTIDTSLTIDLTNNAGATIPNGSSLSIYNTDDQVTNYERVRQYWSANVFNISAEAGGTGTVRNISISSGTASLTLSGNSTPLIKGSIGSSSAAVSLVQFTTSGTGLAASSGNQSFFTIEPTWNQSSTASGTDLLISRTETAVGSGLQYLVRCLVGGSIKWYLDNLGNAVGNQFYTNTFFANASSANNAKLAPNTTGLVLSRNIADANPATVVDQINAGSTGNIVDFRMAGTSRFLITSAGLITLANQTTTVGASVGTLTNCPTAGNPTGYLQMSINGATGKIPYWT